MRSNPKVCFYVSSTVVTQAYTVNLMEESVLRGNAAILKCHISTFVTEYVSVSSWIVSEGENKELEITSDEASDLGIFHLCCFNYSYTVLQSLLLLKYGLLCS